MKHGAKVFLMDGAPAADGASGMPFVRRAADGSERCAGLLRRAMATDGRTPREPSGRLLKAGPRRLVPCGLWSPRSRSARVRRARHAPCWLAQRRDGGGGTARAGSRGCALRSLRSLRPRSHRFAPAERPGMGGEARESATASAGVNRELN